MHTLLSRISTVLRLGIGHVITVTMYRMLLRFGAIKTLLPPGTAYQSPVFTLSAPPSYVFPPDTHLLTTADALCDGCFSSFSHHPHTRGTPPKWFLNPFTGKRVTHSHDHWSQIPDFDVAVGDIKCVWEVSRFDWAIRLAQAYRMTGEQRYVTTLNAWISDWTTHNPLNVGPNWKCGQEAAIRMMHVLLAAFLLKNQTEPTSGLRRFVAEHCTRIAPTIRYAVAQNNNHGTSEAAGLYIGGSWLSTYCQDDCRLRQQAAHWQATGAHWLEHCVRTLIAPDGSFSQYSLNYHRVVLDTLNMVEFWRREWHGPEFSALFYQRAAAAVNWLYQMIEPKTGDGPNVGANDGARVFPLSATDYRDYRPSVQLGAALFTGQRLYQEHGTWNEPFQWLQIASFPTSPQISTRDNGIQNTVTYAYPVEALREGLVNAVCHRDYAINGSAIRVFVFHDRLEIRSPGGLPNTMTLENIRYRQFTRNQMIASFLTGYGYMERRGKGILRMLKLCADAGIGCEFALTPDLSEFVVTYTPREEL